MENRFLKLPFNFDPVLLEKDLDVCLTHPWVQHFNQNDFSGTWESISLRSLSGEAQDIYAHPGEYHDTGLLHKCSYFSAVVDLFKCRKEAVRLLSLSPLSEIHEHRDARASYEDGVFRVHIPVKTGPQVLFIVDGCQLTMNPGEAWYANFELPHSVRNEGKTARIHLILDCIRNDWSDSIFSQAGFNTDLKKSTFRYDPTTVKKIIAELESMEGEVPKQLIEDIKRKSDL